LRRNLICIDELTKSLAVNKLHSRYSCLLAPSPPLRFLFKSRGRLASERASLKQLTPAITKQKLIGERNSPQMIDLNQNL
jgi:hypothetical protein